jgi:hypothetical protein
MVLTTVADLALLEGYYANFLAHGHLEQVDVIVIPDRKTPAAAFDRCMSLASRGLSIVWRSLQQQECFLRKVGFPSERIPYDSDNHRNVGYLMALLGWTDFLISIDATQELACIGVLEDLLPWLQGLRLDASDYLDAYVSLGHQLEESAEHFKGFIWSTETRNFFHYTAQVMRE